MMDTLQVWAYICRGIAGAAETNYGIHLTTDPADPPKPLANWAQRTAWGICVDATNDHPLIIISVSFEGAWLSEQQRGPLNQVVLNLARHLLFGQGIEPIQCVAFIGKGIGGAPPRDYGIHVTFDQTNQPRSFAHWKKLSRWTLSIEATNGFPPLSILMYYEGEPPVDAWFYSLNQTAQQLTSQVLFGQASS